MSRSRVSVPLRFAPYAERIAHGQRLRDVLRRVDQNVWKLPRRRRSVLDMLRTSERGRVESLLPIKYGRMAVSPFAFFRGSAGIMAGDLAALPRTGYHVQICGDAHVKNLGAYASPDGRIVFDINDFDETWRAPWEWDLKRLATSFVLAGREAGCANALSRCGARAGPLLSPVDRALRAHARRGAGALPGAPPSRRRPGARGASQGRARRPRTSVAKLTVPARRRRRRFAQRPPLLLRVDAHYGAASSRR